MIKKKREEAFAAAALPNANADANADANATVPDAVEEQRQERLHKANKGFAGLLKYLTVPTETKKKEMMDANPITREYHDEDDPTYHRPFSILAVLEENGTAPIFEQ